MEGEEASSPTGRVHQKLIDAKTKDEEVAAAEGGDGGRLDSPVSATRKKLEEAVIMDTITDPNTSVAETRYLAHSMSESLVDDVFSNIITSMTEKSSLQNI